MKQKTEKQNETANAAPVIVKAIKGSLLKCIEIGGDFIVAGVVRGVSTEEGQFGTYSEFTGNFAAKIGETVYRAGKMFLPAVAADLLANAFAEAPAAEGAAPEVEFRLRLRKRADEKSNMGFVWECEPLMRQTIPDKAATLLLGSGSPE